MALIKNSAVRNEATDPAVVIQKLKSQIASLKAEISMLRGEEVKDHLTPEEVNECNQEVERFIKSGDPSDTIVMNDRLKLSQCFYHFKTLYKNVEKKMREGGGAGDGLSAAAETDGFGSAETKDLK